MARTSSKNKLGLTVADLFCGAGGLSAGFRAAGFEPTFALDMDSDSCTTYEANFGIKPYNESIDARPPEEWAELIGDVDVILGGPSCQTFSTQGRRFTWADPKDPRTGLWRHMFGIVEAVSPRAFVLENVPGLTHKGLVYEQDGEARGEIADHFRELGFQLRASILLAADYGVPQLRRRLLVVGVKEGLEFEFPQPTHLGGWRRDSLDKWEDERVRRGLLRHITLGEAIGDLPAPGLTPGTAPTAYLRAAESGYEKLMRRGYKGPLTNHESRVLGEAHAQLVKHVPVGGTWRDIPPHLLPDRFKGGMRRTDSTNLFGRLDPDRPSYTITTQFNNVTGGCFTHPTEDRALSVREGARLQSFPDSFVFHGTIASRCRQIGNAVPPLLAQHIAATLAVSLNPAAEPTRPRKIRSIKPAPAPIPTDDSRRRMRRQPRRDTMPEKLVFAAMESRGFRLERQVEPLDGVRRQADGRLVDEKVALFIDGCFWHGCPVHSKDTKSNSQWWREKIDKNKVRDEETTRLLQSEGWLVLRVWEHENPENAADRLAEEISSWRQAGQLAG